MARKTKRSAWGSITDFGRGKHVIRWMENTPEGRKRRSKTVRGTRREAALELARLRVELADDRPVPTVGQAYRMWYLPSLERRLAEGKVARSTVEQYGRAWKNDAGPRWGSVPVDSVVPYQFQEWLLGLTPGGAASALIVMRGTLDLAAKSRAIPASPLGMAFEMPARRSSRSAKVLGLEEADALFGSIAGSPAFAPFLLACFGGCRTGESLGVMASEVRPAESHGVRLAVAKVVRSMPHSGCRPLPDGELKNPQSVRSVVLPERYGEALLSVAGERGRRGVLWLADRGDGLPLNKSRLRDAWVEAAGASFVPFANLRNSWRTFAEFRWGIGHDTMELLMGHALKGVSGRHYIRPSEEEIVASFAASYARFLAG